MDVPNCVRFYLRALVAHSSDKAALLSSCVIPKNKDVPSVVECMGINMIGAAKAQLSKLNLTSITEGARIVARYNTLQSLLDRLGIADVDDHRHGEASLPRPRKRKSTKASASHEDSEEEEEGSSFSSTSLALLDVVVPQRKAARGLFTGSSRSEPLDPPTGPFISIADRIEFMGKELAKFSASSPPEAAARIERFSKACEAAKPDLDQSARLQAEILAMDARSYDHMREVLLRAHEAVKAVSEANGRLISRAAAAEETSARLGGVNDQLKVQRDAAEETMRRTQKHVIEMKRKLEAAEASVAKYAKKEALDKALEELKAKHSEECSRLLAQKTAADALSSLIPMAPMVPQSTEQ